MAGKKRGPKPKFGIKMASHTIRLVDDYWAHTYTLGDGCHADGIRTSVKLTKWVNDDRLQKVTRIGDGDPSEGIRITIEAYEEEK